jgi:hypothetical protein
VVDSFFFQVFRSSWLARLSSAGNHFHALGDFGILLRRGVRLHYIPIIYLRMQDFCGCERVWLRVRTFFLIYNKVEAIVQCLSELSLVQ